MACCTRFSFLRGSISGGSISGGGGSICSVQSCDLSDLSHPQPDDPFAANRQKRILERMDDYHLRQRRHLFYSPMRQDPFADGREL